MYFDTTRDWVERHPWLVFFGISIAVIGAWLTYHTWGIFTLSSDLVARGQFGDSYGALNTLFSGLAFAALITAVMLQTKELALQRKELQDTREELRRTANAQERMESALSRQAELQAITVALSGATARLQFYGRNSIGASSALQAIEENEAALAKLLAGK